MEAELLLHRREVLSETSFVERVDIDRLLADFRAEVERLMK